MILREELNGLRSAEAEEAIITTTYEGKFLADMSATRWYRTYGEFLVSRNFW